MLPDPRICQTAAFTMYGNCGIIMLIASACLLWKKSLSLKSCFLGWHWVACVILLTMASMFLGWTSNTRTIIVGVQGRYFIPVFPLLILPLSIRKVRIPEKLMNLSIIFASGLNVFIIAELLFETLPR